MLHYYVLHYVYGMYSRYVYSSCYNTMHDNLYNYSWFGGSVVWPPRSVSISLISRSLASFSHVSNSLVSVAVVFVTLSLTRARILQHSSSPVSRTFTT